jgi:hypothetical protein
VLVKCSSSIFVGPASSVLEEEIIAEGRTLANPKSKIFAWPCFVTKIFAGLISRWTILSVCAPSSPCATWRHATGLVLV